MPARKSWSEAGSVSNSTVFWFTFRVVPRRVRILYGNLGWSGEDIIVPMRPILWRLFVCRVIVLICTITTSPFLNFTPVGGPVESGGARLTLFFC